MDTWQERVIEERDQLADKLAKLVDFLAKGKGLVLSYDAYGLLVAQELAMRAYLSVLDRRIATCEYPEVE